MKIKRKNIFVICCCIFISLSASTEVKASDSKERIAGINRYETAIQISKAGWVDESKSVVLATGQDFPDALCAVPLAKKLGAPILLNIKSKLLPEVEQEIRRLKVEEIFIIGGPGVISDDILNTLNAMNIKCTRIYGANRYETSINVAKELDKSTEIVVATGENFPDAISISSIAAEKGMPILLTGKNNLPSSVAEYLKDNVIETTYVVGGNDVVSDEVASNFLNVERLQGYDRYDTNVAVLNKFSKELDFNSIYVTTGNNYPDALAASALACQSKSPVCLVSDGSVDKLKSSIASKLQATTKIRAIGEEDVVSEDIVEELLQKYGNTNGNLKSGDMSNSREGCGFVAIQGSWDYYYMEGSHTNYSGHERDNTSPGGLYKIKKDGNKSILLNKDSYSIINGTGAFETKSNINVFGEWIYYEKIINIISGEDQIIYTEGIYKIKTDGTNKTRVCSDNAREMMVIGDWIYYRNESDKGKLYKIKVDGTNRTKITDDACYRINFSENYIYYLKGNNGAGNMPTSLYKIKFDGTDKSQIPCSEHINFMNVEGDFIYYLTYDLGNPNEGSSFFKMKTDGTEKVKLYDTEPGSRVFSFNVSNGDLYFWFYDGWDGPPITNNSLNKMSSDGKIQSTEFKSVIVADEQWIVRNKIYYAKVQGYYNNIYRTNMDDTNLQLINKVKYY